MRSSTWASRMSRPGPGAPETPRGRVQSEEERYLSAGNRAGLPYYSQKLPGDEMRNVYESMREGSLKTAEFRELQDRQREYEEELRLGVSQRARAALEKSGAEQIRFDAHGCPVYLVNHFW